LDLGNVSALVLLEFSKAFDSFSHRQLCSKFEFGFAVSATALIKWNLSNSSSILGPIPFSLFGNDVQSAPMSFDFHLYADDAQVYHSCPADQVERLSRELSEGLSRVASWSVVNGLGLNVPKPRLSSFLGFRC
jgi:hypothetical protein